jgi:hypothetical protein
MLKHAVANWINDVREVTEVTEGTAGCDSSETHGRVLGMEEPLAT